MKEHSGYKSQIQKKLYNLNWEIVEIKSNLHWWDDENWWIQYSFDQKISFYLCFIVDPMFEGHRKKGQGIYEIKATTEFPKNWNDNSFKITSLDMTKRKFDIKLNEFLRDLEKFKEEKIITRK